MNDDLRAALDVERLVGAVESLGCQGNHRVGYCTGAIVQRADVIAALRAALATPDGLDEDRLARAVASAGVHVDVRDPLVRNEPCESCARGVRVIAREYAALRSTP